MNQAASLISVIMPVYNSERFLKKAVESILSQTYKHFELILVDDGSTDSTAIILSKFSALDKRIKIFRHKINLGIVNSRNDGFNHISPESRYIAIMDADDISRHHRLEQQFNFLEQNKDYALVGGHTIIIDENDQPLGIRKYILYDKEIRKIFCREDPFAQPAVMLRREAIEKCGIYDPQYRTAEDYDLWFRIADKFKVANLDEVVLDYRIGKAQSKKTMLKEALHNSINIQKKWLFDRRYFSFLNLLHFAAEHLLILLPDNFVLWFFKKLKYQTP